MEYSPHNWVVLKIKEFPDSAPFYKVLGGWIGGYLDSNAWRLNSGISFVKQNGEMLEFFGRSGSIYRCHAQTYGVRQNIAGTLDSILKMQTFEGQVEVMPEKTDWATLIDKS